MVAELRAEQQSASAIDKKTFCETSVILSHPLRQKELPIRRVSGIANRREYGTGLR
jgi:hypothetical protein